MKKQALFLSGTILLLSALSCKKNQDAAPDPQAQQKLQGTYKFISLTAHTQSNVNESIGAVSSSTTAVTDYTTTNNAGTVVITADMISATGLTYAVSTDVRGAVFLNGQFQDSLNFPFDVSLPATSSSSSYKLIGSDSLYFSAGGFLTSVAPPSGGTVPTTGSGGRFTFHADTLILTSSVKQSTTQVQQGTTIKTDDFATETVRLKKQ
jgi:hypothetical protein